MTRVPLTLTELTEPGGALPLLVVGPSLGTSVAALWSGVAGRLTGVAQVLGWDLPGHGRSGAAPANTSLSMADLAAGVVDAVDRVAPGATVAYAGDSVGGAVGLQLLLDAPDRVRTALIISSGAVIGDPGGWRERAGLVRSAGTRAVLEQAVERWFAPGFLERDPVTATALLDSLRDTDRHSYAVVCEALADFDVRDRLREITAPVLVATGVHDQVTPVELGRQTAAAISGGRFTAVPDAAHLPPAEQPGLVADLITGLLDPAVKAGATAATWRPHATLGEVHDAGMAVRRQVLGEAHVDRAVAATDHVTADFQDFIARYAWGSVWTRPGLDRRSRSIVTLTALVAGGHHEELAMHVRAARRNGLTVAEIAEVLLQTAVYCGVPAANSAFRIAQQTLRDLDDEERA